MSALTRVVLLCVALPRSCFRRQSHSLAFSFRTWRSRSPHRPNSWCQIALTETSRQSRVSKEAPVRQESGSASLSLPRFHPVDFARYQGTWHEIAQFPNRFQKRCVGDVSANYSFRQDGKI